MARSAAQQVATPEATPPAVLVASNDVMPAHLSADSSRGNENVGSAVAIPRIKLLQKMSNQVDKHHAEYIEGAEPGLYYNSVTNEVYGERVCVISLNFTVGWAVWRDIDAGGGYLGTYNTEAEAQSIVAEQDNPKEYDVSETHSHVLLTVNPNTGEISNTPCIMDFASSKLPVSRNWNSNIGLRGGDRFASVWTLGAVSKESRSGKVFMNTTVDWLGWATKEHFDAAAAFYEQYK